MTVQTKIGSARAEAAEVLSNRFGRFYADDDQQALRAAE